jgi:tetratricopeptide (TPR) repeat protein
MPYKIRIPEKKQLVAPVEALKGRYHLMMEWISTRRSLVFSMIAIFTMVLISVPAYWFIQLQSEEKAWGLEREAARLFHEKPTPLSEADKKDPAKKEETQTERWEKAAVIYDEIIKDYAKSSAAAIAQYNAGNVYFNLKKYDLAEERYKSFLKKETHQKELFPLVHLRLAYLYQEKKDHAKALDSLRIAYEWEGSYSQDHAGFEKGLLLEKIGNKKEAIDTYKKVSEQFKESPWGTEAKARLVMLDPASAVSATSTPLTDTRGFVPPIVTSSPQPVAPPPAIRVKDPIPSVSLPKKRETPPPPPPVVVVPAAQTPSGSPDTPVAIEITPDQLRLLKEKGTLTVPLPAPVTPVAPSSDQTPAPVETEPVPSAPTTPSEPQKEEAPATPPPTE